MAFQFIPVLVKITSVLGKVTAVTESAKSLAGHLPRIGGNGKSDITELKSRLDEVEKVNIDQTLLIEELSESVRLLARSLRRVLVYSIIAGLLTITATASVAFLIFRD